MLEVQNLSYSTKTFSMENVSFSLDDGYLMTLLGRNGAGIQPGSRQHIKKTLPKAGRVFNFSSVFSSGRTDY